MSVRDGQSVLRNVVYLPAGLVPPPLVQSFNVCATIFPSAHRKRGRNDLLFRARACSVVSLVAIYLLA